ncbi:hypothetical protein F3Y22_tig00012523pilonHSYRG00031 [Hibiscus syriacus]|uniref:Uncharacterized protein n=1 Tax=Hibiscus syriacus TaxID=106335 RepID=A0A6A3C245_HIBSY|nr:hypothetical protein F3Y22_tig00012523pilonHSYRG00031 [Hibiscus syriacus]
MSNQSMTWHLPPIQSDNISHLPQGHARVYHKANRDNCLQLKQSPPYITMIGTSLRSNENPVLDIDPGSLIPYGWINLAKETSNLFDIDSVPPNNSEWIRIYISPGLFREKITIPPHKPCIYLEGSRKHYNIPPVVLEGNNSVVLPLAARIYGDKSAFYSCGFFGLQDTLWDVEGCHYFYGCYIEGELSCKVTLGKYEPQYIGYITAQGQNSSDDPGMMLDIIVPLGWDAWDYVHQEGNLVYVEANCKGPGADTSGRVPWMKRFGASQLHRFVNMSYIDKEGWIDKLPIKS